MSPRRRGGPGTGVWYPATADASALADAMLDARNAGWTDGELVVLVEAVGTPTGLWRTSEWATLRLGLHA